ncbi:hypothetical protein CBR_g18863 [Chara braunii]|uniref:PA14 domain-containing protein n=1 Tax=Chara braunii TaxID=69332 RepID=A0A388KWU5_CHABU|nr:hypothetical protein CBR_g18863 [Chara braunii]|eukprot:GBG74452.1 hypothetical protein CBR_g18863 [Chara braunii]
MGVLFTFFSQEALSSVELGPTSCWDIKEALKTLSALPAPLKVDCVQTGDGDAASMDYVIEWDNWSSDLLDEFSGEPALVGAILVPMDEVWSDLLEGAEEFAKAPEAAPPGKAEVVREQAYVPDLGGTFDLYLDGGGRDVSKVPFDIPDWKIGSIIYELTSLSGATASVQVMGVNETHMVRRWQINFPRRTTEFPLLQVDMSNLLGRDINVTTSRLRSLSPPVTGMFEMSFRGKGNVSVPWDASSEVMRNALDIMLNLEPGVVSVTKRSSCCWTHIWEVQFDAAELGGDLPCITLSKGSFTGLNTYLQCSELRKGTLGRFQGPVTAEYLRLPVPAPTVVNVRVNRVLGQCRDGQHCALIYDPSLTPSIMSVSPKEGTVETVFTISGSGFVKDMRMIQLFIGHKKANVRNTTETTIMVVPALDTRSGPSEVKVLIMGVGQSIGVMETSARVMVRALKVGSASPKYVALQGQTLVTISGRGFDSAELTVQFGIWGPAVVLSQSVTSTSFVCVSPPALEINGTEELIDIHVFLEYSDGFVENATLAGAVAYVDPTASETQYAIPIITALSAQELPAGRPGYLNISGWFPGDYASNQRYEDVVISIGGDMARCHVIAMRLDEITCRYSSLQPGYHNVTVSLSGNGTTVTNGNDIEVRYGIFSISPSEGSIAGGTELVIQGEGFVPMDNSEWANVVFISVPASSSNPNGVVPSRTPFIMSMTPSVVQAGSTLYINGSNLQSNASVFVNDRPCPRSNNIHPLQPGSLECKVPYLAVGVHRIRVSVPGLGNAASAGDLLGFVLYTGSISTMSPTVSSLAGGLTVTVTGSGFNDTHLQQNQVQFGSFDCKVRSAQKQGSMTVLDNGQSNSQDGEAPANAPAIGALEVFPSEEVPYSVPTGNASEMLGQGEELLTCQVDYPKGLIGKYYVMENLNNLPNFEGLVPSATRLEPNITFDDNSFRNLRSLINDASFAAEFMGYIFMQLAGTYQFFIMSDDGVRLFIDNTKVLEDDRKRGPELSSGSFYVSRPNEWHLFYLQYFQWGGTKWLQFFWQPPAADVITAAVDASALPPSASISDKHTFSPGNSLMVAPQYSMPPGNHFGENASLFVPSIDPFLDSFKRPSMTSRSWNGHPVLGQKTQQPGGWWSTGSTMTAGVNNHGPEVAARPDMDVRIEKAQTGIPQEVIQQILWMAEPDHEAGELQDVALSDDHHPNNYLQNVNISSTKDHTQVYYAEQWLQSLSYFSNLTAQTVEDPTKALSYEYYAAMASESHSISDYQVLLSGTGANMPKQRIDKDVNGEKLSSSFVQGSDKPIPFLPHVGRDTSRNLQAKARLAVPSEVFSSEN